ncbi:uncharacterized protein PV07_12698 [Cladophialophora immunda]|uniref:F-box domain-containing protein n=1 Tax=Cladophialophora immunda TaxID=569365 RepID=A0A0D2BTY9_9EURO|nr:uncharacterized protein PV07_12698 [Cladophialophora immunda]KIW21890.1 hypothetical protein PV07_12698 [Cladophialophora immunda]
MPRLANQAREIGNAAELQRRLPFVESPLGRLPGEILHLINHELTPPDSASFRLTCWYLVDLFNHVCCPIRPASHVWKVQYPLTALSRCEALQRELVERGCDIEHVTLFLPRKPCELHHIFTENIHEKDLADIWDLVSRMKRLRALDRNFRSGYGDRYLKTELPRTLTTLCLYCPNGLSKSRVPQIRLRELPELRELGVWGSLNYRSDRVELEVKDFVKSRQDTPRLRLLCLHQLSMSLNWLSFVGQSLRHLFLSGISTSTRLKRPVKFERLAVLEILWCDLGRLAWSIRKKFDCPHLSHFSMTGTYTNGDWFKLPRWAVEKHPLQTFALRVRAADPLECRNGLEGFFRFLVQRRDGSGTPRRCLVQSSCIDARVERGIRFESDILTTNACNKGPRDRNADGLAAKLQESLQTRAELLQWVDDKGVLYETRAPRSVWRTGPFYRESYVKGKHEESEERGR